jgi:murein DD-endopeptidase MepM/ murein hydrolase activator NlpD
MPIGNQSFSRPLKAADAWIQRQQQSLQEQAKLRQAAQMFEAQFLKMMMGEMRKTINQDKLFGGGFGEGMFTASLDEARADQIVQGRSIGISAMLEKQLGQTAYQRPLQFRMTAIPSMRQDGAPAAANAPASPAALKQPGGERKIHPTLKTEAAGSLPAAPPKNNGLNASASNASHYASQILSGPPANQPEEKASLIWPLDSEISSQFGMRYHPILGYNRNHNGVDLKAPSGAPIQAAGDGTVIFAGNRGQLGRVVIIEHADGGQTVYGHCSRLLVQVGQEISQGQTIAKVGDTGLTTGSHLHFEVRDPAGTPIDPKLALAARNRQNNETIAREETARLAAVIDKRKPIFPNG